MNKDQISADEEFARKLLEQEEKELEAIYNRDLELAKQLQVDAQPVIVDLTTESVNDDADLALAKQLDREWNNNAGSSSNPLADFFLAKQLEAKDHETRDFELAKQIDKERINEADVLGDTIPDLHELFLLFNSKYFSNQLDTVEVKWSTRMTRCAGTCTFRIGGHCLITMSEPLLKFRPKSDMINTLLHEMIHALLFLTQRNTDRDGHGPEFLKEADRINKLANSNITVYHTFHDEVDHYLTHVWQCNGVCRTRPPYFGIVKRSMNRPPQKADTWYEEHQSTCGGTWTKISEPPNTKKRKTTPQIDTFFDTKNKKTK